MTEGGGEVTASIKASEPLLADNTLYFGASILSKRKRFGASSSTTKIDGVDSFAFIAGPNK